MIRSFLGAIGCITDDSGLQELFNEANAAVLTNKIMTGHAYLRALRAHILAHLALAKVVFTMLDITEDEQSAFCNVLSDISSNDIPTNIDEPEVINIANKFSNKLDELESRGATSRLWVQYFKMITIVKN
ncbi:hypothetical protein AVEN_20239-1 [Araneus ventricosus]|uniref:Uncharacterized protein n=1 Tax=Araneus ventricosus TaxID=182803 RepID=A0A4Y2CM70_ARAVE|nr:hypothetical protein AVEN_20239-1 [Araneus ventricosus]